MSILDILATASADTLEHLGEPVTVNGAEYTGIHNEIEYEDETGIKKMVTVSFSLSDVKLFSRGDPVIARDVNYRIDKIPPTDSPLVDIELKYA